MTISTETAIVRTAGNGVTTAFPFPYHFFTNGSLLVYLVVTATGVATLQTLSTHYTVSGADDPDGGTVTFLSAPASTRTVVILRKPDLAQTVNFTAFVAETANDALDRLYERLQYDAFRMGQAIRLPDTAAPATLEIPHDRAEKALGFDADGNLAVIDRAEDLLEENQIALASIQAYAQAAAASANTAASEAGDAEAAATAAAASALAAAAAETAAESAQSAAATSASNASTSAANAASSASSASTSASSASTSASNAATSETNAAASAAAALNSRNNAEGFADDAAASAAAALTSENNAETAENAAEAAQVAAEAAQAGAVAAQAATYIARDVAIASSENPAFTFRFDSSTTDADPGAGEFRLNNATLASVTAVYIDNLDLVGNAIEGWLATFDDNNDTNRRGHLIIRGVATDSAFFVGLVTGTVVDGTGYRKISVTRLASGGTFTDGEPFSIFFAAAGDKGDVTSSANITDHAVVRGDGGAKDVQDSGVLIDDSDNVTGVNDLDVGGALDVGGNITVGGTVDGRDIAADGTKLDLITITQGVDLDAIETRVNSLDAAVVLRGTWDASSGSFPGGGTAQAGDSYIVSTGGTVDSVVFVQNDRIIAIADNASTTTFAANWFKADYTDAVLSVAGRTGAVTLAVADITDMTANGRSLVSAANYAAMRGLLDLEAGTDFYSIAAADAAFAAIGRTLTAGAGLTGGGTLAADRTFAVGAGTGIVANADDVAIDKASDANVRAAASNKVLTSDHLESASALVSLSSSSNATAVDWDSGICFSLSLSENTAISNPTNGQPGTFRHIYVVGASGTRTVTFGNQFLGEVPTITDVTTTKGYVISIMCLTSSHFVASAKRALG